jgi:predicted DCC family thiol-disulfide oxidoreductase YuxK
VKTRRRVAQPPERPLGIFDGNCGFCRLWLERWKSQTGRKVDYAPSQEVAARFPEIPKEAFSKSFQLVLPDGEVLQGAEAVLATLARIPGRRGLLRKLYGNIPGLAPILELVYRIVAAHRSAALRVTHLLWGKSVLKPTYAAASALFLRLLGLCYLAAFVSLWVQIDGLVGSNGILPVGRFLDWIRGQTGAERYWLAPTLSWVFPGDAGLHALCGVGAAASIALLLGFAPAASAAVAWICYLSLSVAGQVFLQFQWDILLTEAGLLAIFLAAPFRWRIRSGLSPSPVARFLLVCLLLRVMFSSGVVKLASGDPAWRDLTALQYHYWTQPLPPWTAWFMNLASPELQKLSCAFLFVAELLAPLLFFAPRRLRLLGFGLTIVLETLIALTGNYAFFNLLAIALAFLLLDDDAFPRRWRESAHKEAVAKPKRWPKSVLAPAAVVLFLASAVPFAATLGLVRWIPSPLVGLYRIVAPFRSTSSYGLFAIMTKTRLEIVVEGSDDGVEWRAYEFRWKPGDPKRRPAFVAPHQPRVDWQMWFAALGRFEENPWFAAFLQKLLEGSPAVERLLEKNPFPDRPPRYIRAVAYDYRFTDGVERRRSGAWWTRRALGPYGPVLESSEGFTMMNSSR